jgi:predicted SnoaL-like aldol condensation-catalyzing enzyme
MGHKLDNVIALFADGVVDGLVLQAADKYLSPACVDHTSLEADGRRSFMKMYLPLVSRFSDRLVKPMRGFEDGPRVFLHSYQSFGRGQVSRVCVDVFDTDDDDLITARWNVSVPAVSTRSGRSQIDGPAQITDLGRTEANKATILRYVREVLIDGQYGQLERYVGAEYAEHSPAIADGPTGLRHFLAHHVATGTRIRDREPGVIVGCGNFVVTFDSAALAFDIYRLAGGRIVEHWDAA